MYSATWKAVTLQDLGDHTSTLPDQPPNIFGTGTLPVVDRPCYPAQILQNYAATYDAPSMTTVGTSYLYSDIGFGLLGDALEGIYDAPYYDLTNSLVLEPLGMTHTFDVSGAAAGYGANYATPYLIDGNTPEFHWPYNAWPGGGTLRSTAPDMMNYLLAAMRLSSNPKINTAMKTAQTPVGTVAGPNPQGLAWSNITLKATKTGDAFTVTQKDGATGGMTAWIGLVNPGTKDGTGVLVMVNEVGGGDEPGAASPATGIGSAILRDLGP
jgi:CubicO group peptidase (beta-lactamase class C family)